MSVQQHETPQKARVFFALWPPPSLQADLAQMAQVLKNRAGGRALPAERLHLTMAFIGPVLPVQIEALQTCAGEMPCLRASLNLDRIGFWARTGVVWIGSQDPDPRLLEFTAQLQHRIQRLGFRLQDRDFRPHITLLRRARRRGRIELTPLRWDINEFSLTRSELDPAGANYTILRRWSAADDVE